MTPDVITNLVQGVVLLVFGLTLRKLDAINGSVARLTTTVSQLSTSLLGMGAADTGLTGRVNQVADRVHSHAGHITSLRADLSALADRFNEHVGDRRHTERRESISVD